MLKNIIAAAFPAAIIEPRPSTYPPHRRMGTPHRRRYPRAVWKALRKLQGPPMHRTFSRRVFR